MTSADISIVRLNNQEIVSVTASDLSAQDLVHHMGALQAQDYEMVKWAMGIRLPGSSLETIESEIEKSAIIRTHILRPTWHFVAAKDLRWMLKLTAPRIRSAMLSHSKTLGLTEKVINKSNSVIAKALTGGRKLTRKELVAALENTGFENINNRASLLLLRAELDGIICSGASRGKEYTYALMDDHVPQFETLTREDALAQLARTYFSSHGPATLEDFAWWSGLTKTSARKAVEMIETHFRTQEIDGQAYWFSDPVADAACEDRAYLLPAYDEFIISYKTRDMIIPDDADRKKAILNNGIFRPVIVVNGQVMGIWKRSVKEEIVEVKFSFFDKPVGQIKRLAEEAAEKLAAFLGKRLEIGPL